MEEYSSFILNSVFTSSHRFIPQPLSLYIVLVVCFTEVQMSHGFTEPKCCYRFAFIAAIDLKTGNYIFLSKYCPFQIVFWPEKQRNCFKNIKCGI